MQAHRSSIMQLNFSGCPITVSGFWTPPLHDGKKKTMEFDSKSNARAQEDSIAVVFTIMHMARA
jgi:hypothetical protein